MLRVVETGGDVVDRAFGEGEHAIAVDGIALGDALGLPEQVGLGRIEEWSDRLEAPFTATQTSAPAV